MSTFLTDMYHPGIFYIVKIARYIWHVGNICYVAYLYNIA